MTDPRSHVRAGQKLALAASQVNWINQQMRGPMGFLQGGAGAHGLASNIVLVRNDSGASVARWGVLEVTGIVHDPDAGEAELGSFQEQPCVIGDEPGEAPETFVVALEPIPSGAIGRAAASGVVQIEASGLELVRDLVGVLWEGNDWALVRMAGGGGGAIRLFMFSSPWPKGTSIPVTRIKGDGTEITPAVTFDVINWFASLDSGCAPRKGAAAKIDNVWVLIAAECI